MEGLIGEGFGRSQSGFPLGLATAPCMGESSFERGLDGDGDLLWAGALPRSHLEESSLLIFIMQREDNFA